MKSILPLLLLTATLANIGCAPAGSGSGTDPNVRPYVADYWADRTSQERLELIGVSLYGTASGMTFSYPTPPVGDVRCTVLATFNGTVKSGTITVASPDGLFTQPTGQDTTLCQWMRSANSYQIAGRTLTIYYGSGLARSFDWNGVQ